MAEAQSNSHTASITPSHTTFLTLRSDHALNLSHSHVSRSLTLHDANRRRRRAPI